MKLRLVTIHVYDIRDLKIHYKVCNILAHCPNLSGTHQTLSSFLLFSNKDAQTSAFPSPSLQITLSTFVLLAGYLASTEETVWKQSVPLLRQAWRQQTCWSRPCLRCVCRGPAAWAGLTEPPTSLKVILGGCLEG